MSFRNRSAALFTLVCIQTVSLPVWLKTAAAVAADLPIVAGLAKATTAVLHMPLMLLLLFLVLLVLQICQWTFSNGARVFLSAVSFWLDTRSRWMECLDNTSSLWLSACLCSIHMLQWQLLLLSGA